MAIQRRGWRLLSAAALVVVLAGMVLPGRVHAIAAQRKLEDAIRKNPRNLKLWWKLGIVYFKQRKYTGAAKAWLRVARRKPTLAKVRYMIGMALFKAKRYRLAAKHWQQALCVDRSHRKARDGLTLLARKGIIEIDDVGPARSCGGERPGATGTQVVTAQPDPGEDEGDGEEEESRPSTPSEPPKPDSPNVLDGIPVTPDSSKAEEAWEQAKRMRKLGHHTKAIEALEDAYRYGYAETEVHYYLGRSLLEDEEVASAVFHLEKAKEANQDDHTIYLAIGKAHSLSGRTEQEIAFYQQALQIYPDYGEAHFMLALAYDKVENSPKVLEHAQKAIRIDPDYKEKLKPRIKDSNVSRKIGAIVTRVLEDSKFERLNDEKIEEYAEEIGRILGEENLNTEEFMGDGDTRGKVRGILQDVRDGRGEEALDRIPRKNRGKFLRVLRKRPELREVRRDLEKNLRR